MSDARLVVTAGQGPFDADGVVLGLGDARLQIRQAFENLATVLEAVGASLDTVVSQTV